MIVRKKTKIKLYEINRPSFFVYVSTKMHASVQVVVSTYVKEQHKISGLWVMRKIHNEK